MPVACFSYRTAQYQKAVPIAPDDLAYPEHSPAGKTDFSLKLSLALGSTQVIPGIQFNRFGNRHIAKKVQFQHVNETNNL